jgi:MFS family permease
MGSCHEIVGNPEKVFLRIYRRANLQCQEICRLVHLGFPMPIHLNRNSHSALSGTPKPTIQLVATGEPTKLRRPREPVKSPDPTAFYLSSGQTQSSMNKLYFWSITSALAGFLFGFDTVVISGAEKSIQALWNLTPGMHGIVMGSALYGTVVGALAGAWPTDRWGRRKTLLWIGILYFVSAVWSGLATDAWSFCIARFIGGLGVGISTVAAPLYISEISPPDRRGRLAGMFQFNIVLGILVAFLSNWLLGGIGDHAWRWMMGSEAFPALIYSVACLAIPESPRWLLGRGRDAEAMTVLKAISPEKSAAELEQNAEAIRATPHEKDAKRPSLWSSDLRRPALLASISLHASSVSPAAKTHWDSRSASASQISFSPLSACG